MQKNQNFYRQSAMRVLIQQERHVEKVQFAKLDNIAMIAIIQIYKGNYQLELYEFTFDKNMQEVSYENMILKQMYRLERNYFVQLKFTRNIEYFLFSNEKKSLVVLNLQNNFQQELKCETSTSFESFKLIDNQSKIVSLSIDSLKQILNLEIRSIRLISELLQLISINQCQSFSFCQIINYDLNYLRGDVVQCYQYEFGEYLIQRKIFFGTKPKHHQILINSSTNHKFESRQIEINKVCDILTQYIRYSDLRGIKFYNQNKLIRNFNIKHLTMIKKINNAELLVGYRSNFGFYSGQSFCVLSVATASQNQIKQQQKEIINSKASIQISFNQIYIYQNIDVYEEKEIQQKSKPVNSLFG